MIKIIKHGQTEFNCTCSRCGCEFTYEHEDITLSNFVICPDCGEHCYIGSGTPNSPKIGWPTPGEPVPCNTPSAPANTDPCTDCDWWKKMTQPGGAIYVGDTPCTWCNKGRFNVVTGKVTANDISVKDYTTPCINQLDVNLTTSTSSILNGMKCTTAYNCTDGVDCKEDITQGTVMQTILDCCSKATSDSCNCGDTEGHNSCSGEHKCGSKKNCKGCH